MEKAVRKKLFVGNVPHSCSDAALQEWVESYGFAVESAQIIRDRFTGHSRGFGFVLLEEDRLIKDAIAKLNRQRMDNRPLTVNEAAPLKTQTTK